MGLSLVGIDDLAHRAMMDLVYDLVNQAMAMSLVDRALRADELGEAIQSPAQMQEFVLSHSDSLEASGFVQHLKLPHYVDFQSELALIRKMRAQIEVAP